jgi:hypothetical protein
MSIPNSDMQKLITEIMKLQKNLHTIQREQVANRKVLEGRTEKSETYRKDRELNEQAETLKREIGKTFKC